MESLKNSITDIAGSLGIGSLVLLGGFLIIDGIFRIQDKVSSYVTNPEWAALVALPLLVVSYNFGVLAFAIGEQISQIRHSTTNCRNELFVKYAITENEMLCDKYGELERRRKFMQGCIVAFFILAVGALCEWRNAGDWRLAVTGAAIGSFICICSFIAARKIWTTELNLYSIYNKRIGERSTAG